MKRAALALSAAALAATALTAPAHADDNVLTTAPDQAWKTTTNPYVFSIGDSTMAGCTIFDHPGGADATGGGSLGLGWRDLGHIAWPGADVDMMRARVQGDHTWPWDPSTVTAPGGEQMEPVWFRDAGALVIALGQNDVKRMDAAHFIDTVRWFMGAAHGRPVVWINAHNPPFQDQVNAFDAALTAEALRWPNLKIIDHEAFLNVHPEDVRGDGVHPADTVACAHYDALIAAAVAGAGEDHPRGYWYGSSRTGAGVVVNGWASAWVDPRKQLPQLNIRVGWQHYTRVAVSGGWDGDWYAFAGNGHRFDVTLPAQAAGQPVCLDLLDDAGQWTALGCQFV